MRLMVNEMSAFSLLTITNPVRVQSSWWSSSIQLIIIKCTVGLIKYIFIHGLAVEKQVELD